MTVVVGVASPDGIILASDSRTTEYGPIADGEDPGPYRIASDHADKVFVVPDDHGFERFGVATHGAAFIGQQTIAGVMEEFTAQKHGAKTVDQVAAKLSEFFGDRLRAAMKERDEKLAADENVLGFLVAGYDDKGVGHIREVLLPNEGMTELDLNTRDLGFVPRGQEDIATRIFAGVDWGLVASLTRAGELKLSPEQVESLNDMEFDILYPITMQDAVDFASFVIRTTIEVERFTDGVPGDAGRMPSCGGAIRMLAVSGAGADWVLRPGLSGSTPPGLAEGAATAH